MEPLPIHSRMWDLTWLSGDYYVWGTLYLALGVQVLRKQSVKVLRWGVFRVLKGQTGACGGADTGAVGGD